MVLGIAGLHAAQLGQAREDPAAFLQGLRLLAGAGHLGAQFGRF